VTPLAGYFAESNVAVSFEQNGMWQQAEHMYEAAQAKARSGAMPYTESEYSLWEDHWVMCAQKLQQVRSLFSLRRDCIRPRHTVGHPHRFGEARRQ
jgi:phosphatidylinositol kinase/protein kinase (PI-3  family)